LEIIKSDYTALQSDPLQAFTRTGVFFVRDQAGTRIDLLLSDTPFDREVVERVG